LGFYSKKLSKTEVNYSTFERELLAAVSGIKHFCSCLEGRPFLPAVDQSQTSDLHPQQGFAADFRPLTTTPGFHIRVHQQPPFVPGTSNVVADALSLLDCGVTATALRCAAVTDRAPFDLKDMALQQILCPQVQSLRSSTELHIVRQRVGDLDLLCNAATSTFRPLVPRDFRHQVF
jgi:hypothetical protein